ncbi:MAG TPA: imelysin family protein, partial [Burkholderiales bacterium]|nr:imelysin family protein [Burkholderiales bacterium]
MKHAFLTILLFALPLTPCAAQTIDHKSVAAHYAALVHANYEDTLTTTKNMQKEIHAFLAQPSEASLASSRKAWLAARDVYGQTEAFRFYAGPIDDDKGPEGRINAWPLDESYIDAVQGKPNAGIVNNPKIAITKKRLSALNERGGEENIATGWHAIEFMLWGQDRNEAGPGNRSFEDFVDGKASNAKRRREYLKVVADLLIDDLTFLVTAWAPDAKNYRARFIANENEAVRRMLVGLGSLSRGELAGERLEVALASQDQEDEHSCFSDNT